MLELFDGFIGAIAAETSFNIKKEGAGHYSAVIVFDNGRKQNVKMVLGEDDSGDPVLSYYSRICKVDSEELKLYRDALKMNLALSYGAIGIQDDELVFHNSYYVKSMDPERFIKSLSYVAAKADELEEVLIANDEN